VTLPQSAAATPKAAAVPAAGPEKLSDAELRPMLAKAGATYDLDADLLASVVRQESGGHARAVSRAGAQGLMQLMPGTASELGVTNSFAPGQNVAGGTAYLNALLKKYHDNLPQALAAYNAGPAAVDRWHGIPPYPETRAYVARVIHEYNRRYALRRQEEQRSRQQVASVTQHSAE
jgi:soluble lytic murein transglycosylase-like protein